MVQFHDSVERDEPEPDDTVPPLVDDVESDSDSDENVEEEDVSMYQWDPVNARSLSRKNKKILQRLTSKNVLEFDESFIHPLYVWKVDGFSKRPESDDLYVCYYDVTLPRPRDLDSFEYTLLNKFMLWAIPESQSAEHSRSEGGSSSSLLYLAICTRRDLLYAVHILTRRMSNPRIVRLWFI